MKMLNPLKMNDWNIKHLIIIIIIFQALTWITTILNYREIDIPFLRVFTTFIVMFFLNGILILRILRIHEIGNIKTILYSFGLSITTIMFFGMLVDLVYPFLGIDKPISTFPLLITFTLFTAFLCVLSYRRDNIFNRPEKLNFEGISVPLLTLLLIPFLSIFGTYAMNVYNSNIILILMFFIIAFIPLLVAYNKFIPEKLYPMAIFSMSITLLFSTSLISSYLTGWDINLEYYFSNLVVNSSYWNSSIPDLLNAMLSLVIIVPIFSKISGLSVVSIFKVIYPFLFAFVPLGLYSIFKNQTNTKIAFFACFLFVSIFMFFLEMPYLARQEIGELFFILIIMLTIEDKLSDRNILIFTLFFIPALLVSHYSMDYIYIFMVLTAYLIVLIRNMNLSNKYPRLGRWPILSFFFIKGESKDNIKMRYVMQIILLFSITASYYFLVSSSVLFHLTITTINNLITIGLQFLFNPKALAAVGIVTSEKSFLRTIALVFHLLIEFFIAIGILALILRRTGQKFNENYSLFSVMSFVLLILVLVVPFLAGALNPERFYQIALIFLSVFFVVGWIRLSDFINKLFKYKWNPKSVMETSFKLMALFLAISLMFNSGVVYELLNDKPTSMVLHSSMDGPKFNNIEVVGAEWITEYRVNDNVHADSYRFLLLNSLIPYAQAKSGFYSPNNGSYMFLGTYNLLTGEFGIPAIGYTTLKYYSVENLTSEGSSIYDNGGSKIFI
ncbi:DUF2206 domain-containing protein [Methanobacterium sp. SMA-27]|uniref:DUF2206 domain-containing protein n=1 Tax=Methanobacterium sp. SMA-27 TaxID=1495336 RepID=UPI00064EBB0B|nr:DUF2206 domain-containing protein [Methanobacterium sp. SMA-27]